MKRPSFWTLWGWSLAMGVLTTTGLITALVSDTWGDWWSWVGLGIPVAVMGWHGRPRALRSARSLHAASAGAGPAAHADSHNPRVDPKANAF